MENRDLSLIGSLADYIEAIQLLRSGARGNYYFRGHADIDFKLEPSVFRSEKRVQNEQYFLLELISESPSHFASDGLNFDKLVRAQHFGVPTRLLDLTTNPLMALYFACADTAKESVHGEVICLDVDRDSQKSFNSDKVSCLSNLCYLSLEEKRYIWWHLLDCVDRLNMDLADIENDIDGRSRLDPEQREPLVAAFNEHVTIRRLVHFVKDEKPYFENRIDPIDLFQQVVVRPKKSNPRIAAQSGAFVLFGLSTTAKESDIGLSHTRLRIRNENKNKLLSELEAVGIDEHVVFPELDRIAKSITRRLSE